MTAALSSWSGIGPGSSDAELAIAAADGDRRAFAEIYDRYADRLHDFGIGMLRDRDSAADCVQDAFCIVATSLGGLREPDKLRPWLYSIVRNEAHKRLRALQRERPSDEVPDVASQDASPDTMAHRMELANLINEAAGGLSERDQAVLELAYRQGLDGPELAMALGVTQTNANTMVGRLRDTIERSLGALLVARRVQADPSRCPELTAVLHGWDGKFTILMRKRIARHIESCAACEDLRGRTVNRQALLGAVPLLIPAPGWLKNSVMRDFELTSASHDMVSNNVATQLNPQVQQSHFNYASSAPGAPPPASPPVDVRTDEDKRRVVPIMALLIGIPLLILGGTLAWLYLPSTALSPSGIVAPAPSPTPSATVPKLTPAAVVPSPQPPKASPGPAPVQTPRPAAPLPTPRAKLPTPTPQAPLPTPQAPVPTPAPIQAPVPAPAPIPLPPLGSIPLPRIPLPQNPIQYPAVQPPVQAPAKVPAQAPAADPEPEPEPQPADPEPAPAPKPAPAPAPEPEPEPEPVGPAPKPANPAPPVTDCNVELCVR